MLLTAIPFSPEKNLGAAYNETMCHANFGDWVCMVDHDMMFTTSQWHAQILAAIAAAPTAGAFAAMTNRIAQPWQRPVDAPTTDDVAAHRRFGEALVKQRTLLDVTDTAGWGGVVIVTSKDAWLEVGGFVDGLFCVDHAYHYALRAAGRRVYLIEGLYVYHWRGSSRSREALASYPHAKTADGGPCPCRRMPDPKPTVRVAC
jgi:GT2 family glycosyltransferase